jgi:hypothetical protein
MANHVISLITSSTTDPSFLIYLNGTPETCILGMLSDYFNNIINTWYYIVLPLPSTPSFFPTLKTSTGWITRIKHKCKYQQNEHYLKGDTFHAK